MTEDLHLGVALNGHGWHIARPVTDGRYWSDVVATAERGLLDFVTFDDALASGPDAVLIASRVAPTTRHIGLVPVAGTTHTEPFHVSTAIATLDFVSCGRAGWQPRVSRSSSEAALFGRRGPGAFGDLLAEAADAVEVVRRLWDSWEDDAVIRDVDTGRFIDRDKLHYIDFVGPHFSVKGPSITPRPPQGQPVVAALAHEPEVYAFAARSADLVFVTPKDTNAVVGILEEVARAGGGHLKVWADLYVTFDGLVDAASDAAVFDGDPVALADRIAEWHRLGLHGVRLRPALHHRDLPAIVDEVVPILQQRNVFRTGYRSDEKLRDRLGLGAAVNRYSSVSVS
ncbi:MAG: LLM class flavin-dependent oxidoreductase [Mycobacterium kyogaense]|uniref:LLM class flavin-dependent oxidoreductase n=1 Tax=Mycobacterium kyogaense TaxID=2212479 RepID=UPI002FFC7719